MRTEHKNLPNGTIGTMALYRLFCLLTRKLSSVICHRISVPYRTITLHYLVITHYFFFISFVVIRKVCTFAKKPKPLPQVGASMLYLCRKIKRIWWTMIEDKA